MRTQKQKEYSKKYKEEHTEYIKERKKEYRRTHTEQIKEYNRKWHEEHKDERRDNKREYDKIYYAENKEYRSQYCKAWREMNAEKLKEDRKENPEKFKKRKRKAQLKLLYDLTPEGYDNLLDTQGGVCAICCKPETLICWQTGEVKNLAVDHDKETGEIRGLLCAVCNTSLGKFDHSPERLRRAAAYLEQKLGSNHQGV